MMSMQRRAIVLLAALSLIGQGCISGTPITTSTTLPGGQEATPTTGAASGEPSPDGFIPFREGFGKLPGTARSDVTSRSLPTTILAAPLPTIPASVTVLRAWMPPPDDALLHNLTNALQIPVGMLGGQPAGERVTVRWHDAKGIVWDYDSGNNAILFAVPDAQAAPVIRTGDGVQAIQTVRAFIADHGIDMTGWGAPEARAASVFFPGSRDGYSLVDPDGVLLSGAEMETDAAGKTVIRGHLALPSRSERSDYDALPARTVLERLRAGGTNPIPNAGADTVVSFDHFDLVLTPFETIVDGRQRTLYVPALWARGTMRHGSETSAYATTVPLIADDAFASGS